MTLTVGSLFSGVGMGDLGLQRAGWKHRWFVEVDPWRRKVLHKRWPGVPVYEDIKEVGDMIEGALKHGKWVKLDEEQAWQAVHMYEMGFSCGEVGKYFGVTRTAMWQMLKKRTKMRPRLRYGKQNHFYRGGEKANDHAQNMVEYAVRKGILNRPESCEECGANGTFSDGRSLIQAHHDDYNKPLDVRWLCQPCHHAWHKNHKAVPLRRGDANGSLPGDVDLIAGGFPIRAMTSAQPEAERGLPERSPVFGSRCLESLAYFDPATSSWKIPQFSLLGEESKSLAALPRSGMTRNGTLFRLENSVHPTSGNGSGSWPTPVAHDDGKTPAAHMAMKKRMKGGARKTITSLTVAVKADRSGFWRTPQAWNAHQGPKSRELFDRASKTGEHSITLTDQVRWANWPMPTVHGNTNRKGVSPTSGDGLRTAVNNWPTPRSSDKNGIGEHGEGGPDLRTADSWATPTAQDHKNSTFPESQRDRDSLVGNVMKTTWPTPTKSRRTGLQSHGDNAVLGALNPAWVECLQGVPLGWTDIECNDPQPMPWPAGYVKDGPSPQYDWEPPRTVPPKSVKDRRKRIEALGDGQVPQVTELIGRLIIAHAERSAKG